ncbi:3'-5' exonuclease [Micromonospora sp. NPDC000207]|uniref:3'-5' exonuclease n=1 Tax=Micromonospora sp. NPDC000207 TaxID=3154246 RepID=UPI00331E06DC
MSIFIAGHLTRQPGTDPRTVTFAFVDVETTGTDPDNGARICEIAVVRMRGDGVVLDEYATLVDPGVRPPTGEPDPNPELDVTVAPTFPEIADDLLARLSGAIVVGHSLAFVDRFLSAEFDRLGLALPPVPGLCAQVTARLHLDRDDDGLTELANLLTGEWPSALPSALGVARAMAGTLATLVGTAPEPLAWRGLAATSLPAQPRATPVTPRVVGLRKGSDGWLATLTARLPYTVDPPRPRPDGLREYRAGLARALADGRIVGDEAMELADLAGRAGLTQSTAWQVHEEFLVVHRAHAESDGVVTATELRELQRAAKELGATYLIRDLEEAAAASRARREAPLRGWRVLPVGDSPGVTAAVDLAVEHGATVAVKLTKTVRLVVTDVDAADPRLARAGTLGVPVLTAAQATTLIAEEVATPGTDQAGSLGMDTGDGAHGPRWHEFWRPRELTPTEYRARFGETLTLPVGAPVAAPRPTAAVPTAVTVPISVDPAAAGRSPVGGSAAGRPAVGRASAVHTTTAHAKSGCAVVALLAGSLLVGAVELVRNLVF